MTIKRFKKKRILFVLNTYSFMAKNLKNLSLKKKYSKFNRKDTSWANFFYNSLKKDFFVEKDYPFLNKSHNLNYIENLNNKIEVFKPDIIFSTIDDNKIEKLFLNFNKIKKIIWISNPQAAKNIKKLKGVYNYVISGNNDVLMKSKSYNFKTEHMLISSPFICNLSKKNFYNRRNEIYFAGSLGSNFKKRFKVLNYLASNFKLKIRLRNLVEKYFILNSLNKYLIYLFPNFSNYLFKKRFLPLTNKLKKINEDEIFGRNMLEELKKYKFSININSDFDEKNINSRIFESLSCGCLLFTDDNKTMKNFFLPDKHLVYFNSIEQLKSKINHYRNNIKQAYKIAKEGNALFNKRHQSKIRLKQFKNFLNKII